MKCRQGNEAIMRYFDRQLSDLETATFKQHIKHCPVCAGQFNRLSDVLGSLERAEKVDPPGEFERGVMLKINEYVSHKQEESKQSQTILAIMIMLVFSAPLIAIGISVSSPDPLRIISSMGSYIGSLYNLWTIGHVLMRNLRILVEGLDVFFIETIAAIAIVFSSLLIASKTRSFKRAVD